VARFRVQGQHRGTCVPKLALLQSQLLGLLQAACAPPHDVLWFLSIISAGGDGTSLTLGSMGRLSRWRSHLASQCGPSAAWSPVMSLSCCTTEQHLISL
jgi:hypothetical protein